MHKFKRGDRVAVYWFGIVKEIGENNMLEVVKDTQYRDREHGWDIGVHENQCRQLAESDLTSAEKFELTRVHG